MLLLWFRYLAVLAAALVCLGVFRLAVPWALRLLALVLSAGLLLLATRRPFPSAPAGTHLGALLLLGASVFTAEVLYIHASGLVDQRQPAAVIVVFGAKVHEDGTPSEALAERVATGAKLYHQGYAPTLLVSGGIGREGQNEAAVMKRLAVQQGVPAEAIVEDPGGISTEATLQATRAWLDTHGGGEALMVSHYHHLPRIRLLGHFHGVKCLTVPADEGDTLLAGTPFYVVREAAALAFYFLRG
ncbi:MAG: YdcF family protein [Myxococcales bacterium]|nr:YdcF family protein [Polyangiaceae bacterium]MDW8247835.1 YdcF family protein [Myxococcales bacterium]